MNRNRPAKRPVCCSASSGSSSTWRPVDFALQPDLGQGEIRIAGLDFDGDRFVEPHVADLFRRREERDLRRVIGQHVDRILHRVAIRPAVGAGEAEHVAGELRRLPIVAQGQHERRLRLVVVADVEHDVAAAVGLEIDRRLFDRLVGAGVDRDLRAFDRADVAQAVDAAVGEAGVVGIVVVDSLDGDRRRGDDRDGEFERAGVAGFDAVAEILRDADRLASLAREESAP